MLLSVPPSGAAWAPASAQYGHPGPKALCRWAQFVERVRGEFVNVWSPAPYVVLGMGLLPG